MSDELIMRIAAPYLLLSDFFPANSSATFSASVNSLTLIGLVRSRRYPAFRPLLISCGMALALMASTGMCVVTGSSRRIFSAWIPVSYTHLRAHETRHDLVCR